MAEKTFKGRIVQKHDTESNWALATNFTPKQGEIIIYDIDATHDYERVKIGDGTTNVNVLPFLEDVLRAEIITQINDVDDKVDAVSELIGDTSVSDQINTAISKIPEQVQTDLSQTDNAAIDYVKGIIRQESLPEGYPYKANEFEPIAWDGNIEGKDNVTIDGLIYYKISDLVLSVDDLTGATMTISGMVENGFSAYLPEVFTIDVTHIQNNSGIVSVIIEGLCQIMSTSVTIVDGSELFPSTGTYVLYIPAGTEVFAPNAPNYCSGLTKEVVYKLDPAFYEIPEIPEIPDPDVFWATYGTTTFAEITSAVEEGKTVLVKNNNYICRLSCLTSKSASFLGADANWRIRFVFCENDDSWNWNWLDMVSTAATHEITGKLIFEQDALQLKSPNGSVYQITIDNNGVPTFVSEDISTTINPIDVDEEFSTTSTNPVQNKVVNAAISNLNSLVGDTKVSVQIDNAINKLDLDNTYEPVHQHPYIPTSQKGAVNGVAELDANGKVPATQLPSYVDDVLEYSDISSFPSTGEVGKIYVDMSTNKTYRWGGSSYAEISASLALGTTSSTAYRGDYGSEAYTHSQKTSGNPHGVTKSDIGLGNVPNVATNNQTPTYTASSSLTGLTSGEKLSVAFGKIAKAVSDLISHIGNKSNPHGVTASQVGADVSGAASSALTNANSYTDQQIEAMVGDETVADQISTAISEIPTADNYKNGFMTSTDKKKLDTIESNAQKNVQSDWAQNDMTSMSFVQNRPFYDGPLSITWDGVTTGHPADMYDSSSYRVKITDTIFTDEELQTAKFVINENGTTTEVAVADVWEDRSTTNSLTGIWYNDMPCVYVVRQAGSLVGPGTYFLYNYSSKIYIQSLTIGSDTDVKKIDSKYIPVDTMELITIADIDAICGSTIQMASLSEVSF